MRRLRRWLVPLCLLAMVVPSVAEAHPHVWVNSILTLRCQGGRVVGLHEDWSFDEDFTAAVLRDVVGKQPVTALSAADVAKLEKEAFSNLKNFDYFTHVWEGDAKVAVKDATQFQARLANGKLGYTFSLALEHPVALKGALGFGVWDDSYYVDVEPAKTDPLRFEGDHPASCKVVIVPDHQYPIYFGSVFPTIARVTC